MIAAPQKTVEPEDGDRLNAAGVGSANLCDISGELARWRIAFSAQGADPEDFRFCCCIGQALGKDPHDARVLLRIAVASHDVVIQHRFKLPSLLFRHLSEMPAAVQTLFFA